MSIDLTKAVGFQPPDKPVSWNKRDLITYAIGVGAKPDDLPLIYELHPNFTALPTYPVISLFKGDNQDVVNFANVVKGVPVPGLPKLDPNRGVHGSQSITILKDLPLVSGPGWKYKTRYVGVSENKSGLVLMSESSLVHPSGEVYAKLYSSSFNIGAKATGQKFSKFIAGPPQGKPIPERKPDHVYQDKTLPEQAIIYRLSGDYNPLHIDPKIGKSTGFGGVILHGLSTFGFAARALLKTLAPDDPKALKTIGVRFTSPVHPGDALETQIWEVGAGPDNTTEVAFVTKDLTTGKVVLGSGVAFVKKSGGAKL